MNSTITCRDLIAFLDEYVEGTLSRERLDVFERHLAACGACRAYLEDYRASIGLARALREGLAHSPQGAGVPDDLVEAVRRAIADQGPG